MSLLNLMGDDKSITLTCSKTKTSSTARLDSKFGIVVDDFYSYRYFEFSNILELLIQRALSEYIPDGGRWQKVPEKYREFHIKKWKKGTLKTKYCKMLSRPFREHWLKLLESADQTKVAIDKALTRAVGFKLSHVNVLDFFDRVGELDQYEFQDFLSYRAATLYFFNCYSKCYDTYLSFIPLKINDWKAFYSYNAKAYSQLNKTLMNMKWAVAYHELRGLNTIKLERPLLSRLELLCYLRARENLKPLILKSSKDDILKAAKLYSKLTEIRCDCRRNADLSTFLIWLSDYPETYNGTLVGLVKRSKDWHDRQHRANIVRTAERYKLNTEQKTAKPPFELDLLPKEITFLENVQTLMDEGIKMGHCVGSYAKYAVDGRSYIFHVEHNKESATVELCKSISWTVNQSRGPRNQENSASKWAKKWFDNFIKKEKLNG